MKKVNQQLTKGQELFIVVLKENTCIHPIPSKAAMAIRACGGNGAFLDLIAKAVITPKVVVPNILNIENTVNTHFGSSLKNDPYLWSN